MTRAFTKLVLLAILVVAGWSAVLYLGRGAAVNRQVSQLQQDKAQLQQVVQRLTDQRRVAELLVTDQKRVHGNPQTTLLLVEDARDGVPLAPKSFTIDGDVVHLDAMVIKFDRHSVEQNDSLRGCSIALFHRLYGDQQTPEHGFAIDVPGKIPDYYRGSDPQVSRFEQNLWQNFWRLADDPAYRQQQGVRVANGQGVWFHARPDTLYTLTIERDGGLNYAAEPVKPIYREALRQHGAI